jgi:carbon storage regulator
MLVLSRKRNETVVIDRNIVITFLECENGKTKVGIEAPRNLPVLRGELVDRKPEGPSELEWLNKVIEAMSNVSLLQCQRDTIENPKMFALHPLTCGNHSGHTDLYPVYDEREECVKLICQNCDYTQSYVTRPDRVRKEVIQ